MNDGHDPWPVEIRSGIVEHAPRGFRRVAVTPGRGIERIAEVGRVPKLGTRRSLRALKPSSRERPRRGLRYLDQLTQSASADQPPIRLAHHREKPEVRARVHRRPLDPGARLLGRSRLPAHDVTNHLRIRVKTREELVIVARDPAQHEPLGFDPISDHSASQLAHAVEMPAVALEIERLVAAIVGGMLAWLARDPSTRGERTLIGRIDALDVHADVLAHGARAFRAARAVGAITPSAADAPRGRDLAEPERAFEERERGAGALVRGLAACRLPGARAQPPGLAASVLRQ